MYYRGPSSLTRWHRAADRAERERWLRGRERIIWHEGGHTVIYTLGGGKVDRVVIRSDNSGTTSVDADLLTVREKLVGLAAGEVASAFGVGDDLGLDGLQDRADAAELIRAHNLPQSSYDDATRHAKRLVQRYWRDIMRVADALDAAEELSKNDLKPLLAHLPLLDISAPPGPRNPYDDNAKDGLHTISLGVLGAAGDNDDTADAEMRAYRTRSAPSRELPLLRLACIFPGGRKGVTSWGVDRRGRIC
jgi:hypothetical protein